MRRILALLAAAVIPVVLLAPPAPAQAAPGDQQWSCGSTPPGWVVPAYAGICNPSTRASYLFIQHAEGMPAGSSLTVCQFSPIPSGWRVVYGPVHVGSCAVNWGSSSPNAYIISNS
ncbi:hypothetical protein O7626_24710 [Micromonospora sp. WMMD1102]|uniref:hypothetical protein n=1 Tax=Micromonospora sp. WMMD1102 TaxID=3016105 RepID=UPI002414F60C|nr:hypothetical protein [Micromonospora sp. WMMD1102]MDG4789094.1 hypothetical protein [Micromonospora sp. WMMD1102]